VTKAWRLVAVVSAEYGHTDALAREASELAEAPDPAAIDLLWSTGELRSVALLTLALRAAGVSAVGLNAHQAGLAHRSPPMPSSSAALALRAALAVMPWSSVPGFLATRFQQIVDARPWRAPTCPPCCCLRRSARIAAFCIKDVDGYFTSDPATHNDATPIESLTYTHALAMADAKLSAGPAAGARSRRARQRAPHRPQFHQVWNPGRRADSGAPLP
jgi:hypothetical protein